MAKHIDQEIRHYYDVNPTEEDLMGKSSNHNQLVHHLISVPNQI